MAENSKLLEAVKLINNKFKNKETGEIPITLERVDMPIMSSGIIGIDYASKCGGIPEGKIFEIFGAESSGKTTIALLIAKKYIEQGKPVVFIDAEQAFNMTWAEKLGIPVNDHEKFILMQSSIFEEIFNAIRTFIEVGGVKYIIVDSVAAIVEQNEMDSEEIVGKGMPLFAKNFKRELRILLSIAAKNKCNVVFLNHMVQDLSAKSYVPVQTSPGGKALKFFSSMRMQISKSVEKDETGKHSGWDRVYYFIKRDELFSRLGGGEGYVYIFECPSQPGILKIGETERTPQERLRELNRSSGVIMPWIIHSAFPCKSPRAVEQLVHLELSGCRINSQKEGFAIFPEKAEEVIKNVIKRYEAEIEGEPRDYRKEKKYWFVDEKG